MDVEKHVYTEGCLIELSTHLPYRNVWPEIDYYGFLSVRKVTSLRTVKTEEGQQGGNEEV